MVKLGNIVSKGKSHPLTRAVETLDETGYRYLHYGDIHLYTNNVINNDKELPNIKHGVYSTLEYGDVIVADASEDYDDIGKPAVINYLPKDKVVAGLHTIVLKPDLTLINPLYLYYVLTSPSYKEFVRVKSTGMKVIGLSYSQLKEFEFVLPNIEEQKRISKYLLKIDNVLEKTSTQIENNKNFKQAMLQKMFPKEGETVPEVRFEGFQEKWMKSKIEDCFEESLIRSSQGELLSVTINLGVIKAKDSGRHDNSSADKSNYKYVRKGDIAYNSMRMWQGASGCSKYNGIVSPAYTVMSPNEDIDSVFFSYQFKLENMLSKFETHSQGLTSDTWNLKFNNLKNINVTVPSLEEQRLLASYFTKLDNNIQSKQAELTKLQQFKQAMLDKMFV